MATWQQTRLGEISQIYSGFAFRSQDLGEHGIPVVKIGNIQNKRVSPECADHLPEELCIEKLNRYFLQQGDTLIAMTGAGSVGKVGKMPRVDGRFLVNQRVAIVRPDDSRCDSAFVYFALSQDVYETKLYALGLGAGQPNVSAKEIGDLEIPFPPLPVQRRIAGILSAYDELMENSQRRIRLLEAMARALYREWFVQFRFPGHEKLPRVASPLGDIPQGWEVKPLASLMVDHIGGGRGKDVADEDHTEPAWVIRGTDIPYARSSRVADVPHRFHTVSNLRTRRLQAGDILFEVSGGSKGQPVGRALLVTPQLLSALGDESVICASFCKRVRPDAAGYGSELLYLSFVEGYESGEIEQFQVQSTGISNFKWTEYIAKTERVVPPAPLRVSFRHRVAPLFSQIATLGLKIQNLHRTRDLLLPRLLSRQVELATGKAIS